jgi:hypothetical protein
LMHGTEAPPAECPFSRVVQTKHHEEAEIYDQAKGLWLSVSVDPILDEKGNMALGPYGQRHYCPQESG